MPPGFLELHFLHVEGLNYYERVVKVLRRDSKQIWVNPVFT